MQIEHEAQLGILKQLLFKPESRFAELNTSQLDNNHFNFHLKRLVESGIVSKTDTGYKLTPEGLNIANKLDINNIEIVQQPKLGVLICVTNKGKVLLGKRLKDPDLGKIGFYAKKLKLDESIFETAKRCLIDETGISANLVYMGTVRILEPNHDRMMIYLKGELIGGELIAKNLVSENSWYKYEDAYNISESFSDFKSDLNLFKSNVIFFEERHI